ncbi:MAG TPA: helix-hairpin-helix domain-containing protein, partial [Pyrinomonadaceae bacterium]
KMGEMIASGEAVPLERLEGMNPTMVSTLAGHGVGDIEALADASVDNIAEFLDVSIDQAEALIAAARAVVESARVAGEGDEGEGGEESGATEPGSGEMGEGQEEARAVEQHAASVEADPDAREVEPSEAMIAEGYDEAVRTRPPFLAEDLSEDNILAQESADPVAMTEVEQMSADELILQGAGRDLRPDTITPAPDIFSTEAAVIQNTGSFVEEERPSTLDAEVEGIGGGTVQTSDEGYEDSPVSPRGDFATEASAPEAPASSEPSARGEGEPAPVENVSDDEAEDASADVE